MTWETLKEYGLGVFRLSPDEFWDMGIKDFYDMIVSYSKVKQKEVDLTMQQIAWQTSLLMNSSGNYKKKIKPEDLYKISDPEEEKQKPNKEPIKYSKEESKEHFNNLLKKMGKA